MTKTEAKTIVVDWIKAYNSKPTSGTIELIAGDLGLSFAGAEEFMNIVMEERLNFLIPDRNSKKRPEFSGPENETEEGLAKGLEIIGFE